MSAKVQTEATYLKKSQIDLGEINTFAVVLESEEFDAAMIRGVLHYRTWDDVVCDFYDWRPLFE